MNIQEDSKDQIENLQQNRIHASNQGRVDEHKIVPAFSNSRQNNRIRNEGRNHSSGNRNS